MITHSLGLGLIMDFLSFSRQIRSTIAQHRGYLISAHFWVGSARGGVCPSFVYASECEEFIFGILLYVGFCLNQWLFMLAYGKNIVWDVLYVFEAA